jgi:hypothetical protein
MTAMQAKDQSARVEGSGTACVSANRKPNGGISVECQYWPIDGALSVQTKMPSMAPLTIAFGRRRSRQEGFLETPGDGAS